METLNLFIRQPFTESSPREQAVMDEVLKLIFTFDEKYQKFNYLTGVKAENSETFRTSFEQTTGKKFTPQNFRAHRLALLGQADAFINMRLGMSESSAFEMAYHIYSGRHSPMLFLIWHHVPIKTTLLRDLDDVCDITYLPFEEVSELEEGVDTFFRTKFG